MTDRWGIGDKKDAEKFATAYIGKNKNPVDLVFGEHPHSRSDNNIYARDKHGNINGFDGHRTLLDIIIRSSNYLKESHYSGDEVRKSVVGEILSDGILIYEFFVREPEYALLKAHNIIEQLKEHPSWWMKKEDREKLIGRKIFYHSFPAIITRLVTEQGCVIIEPEGAKHFPSQPWHNNDFGLDYELESSVKDDVLSPHIWWFRD